LPGENPIDPLRVKCGRGLAPDGGVSVSTSVTDPPPSGASPLPHWKYAQPENFAQNIDPERYPPNVASTKPTDSLWAKCGRGLAPDGGVSVSTSVTDPPPSGASPLPHWKYAQPENIAQNIHPERYPPNVACTKPTDSLRAKCGRGLAPDGGVSVSTSVTDPPPSGASPLPHWKYAQPENFGQNIDPERYSPDSNRLKDPFQQLSANHASNGNFPRHTRNIRLNLMQTIFIII
jgi:hypothetical protein